MRWKTMPRSAVPAVNDECVCAKDLHVPTAATDVGDAVAQILRALADRGERG
jgi:hypothetical protein